MLTFIPSNEIQRFRSIETAKRKSHLSRDNQLLKHVSVKRESEIRAATGYEKRGPRRLIVSVKSQT